MRELLFFSLLVCSFGAKAVEQRFILDNYLYGEWLHPEVASANPGNAVLEIPDRQGVADLRPDWSLRSDSTTVVVRPRWIGRLYDISELGATFGGADGRWNLMDAYVEYRASENLRTLAGLEVYQWGPAELMNASNPLFHLRTNEHSTFFQEKGKVLVRVTYDQNQNWNHMLILNPVSNNEEPFRAEQQFQSSGFLKSEWRASSGGSYAGLLAGSDSDRLPFIGEYALLGLESGWSFYLDARHTKGNHSYVPVTNEFGYVEMDPLNDDSTLVTQGIGGVRWEGRVDVRVEFFWNSAGLDSAQFHQALQSVRVLSPWLTSNISRFLQPGLELPGRAYSYLSLRIPDLGPKKDVAVALRGIQSLQDGSGLTQVTFEKPVSDSVVTELEADMVYGAGDSELTMTSSYEFVAGVRWTL